MAVGTAAIYLFGGREVINGNITTGTLVALGVFVTQIYSPLTSLTNARVDLMTAFVSFDRVFEVLDTPNPITDKPDAIALTNPTGSIAFDHVTFAYPSGAESSVASLESAAQLALVAAWDCDLYQGFLTAGALDEAELGRFVAASRAAQAA